ncbi:HAD-IIIC family phosphatase [Streptomyces sp. NPDC056500]|uniref:HAD-IIIC family phosphatase n=1 Tax=Streptomyces sp. NPDC056500 TaxID=3345840 RepID=UPI0036C08271
MAEDSLATLHRAGALTARYPQVRGLLAALTPDQLLRAGRLLSRIDPEEVVAAHPTVVSPTVAVTGHGTLAALVPALTAEFARHGLLPRIRLSDFDGWVFDLVDPGSALYQSRPDLVLCVLDSAVVTDELPAVWRASDVERVLAEKLALVERAATVFATAADAGTLVLNTLPLPRELTAQLVDLRERAVLGALWREANARLLRLSAERTEVITIDLDPLLAEGTPAREIRQSVYAKAHLSDGLLAAYAREVGHLARQSAGGGKKVLALDLDNTVWGGVLGEVGQEGIETSGSYRGEAFRRFQRVVKQLRSQGVLIAAVSKNDQEPVLSALREHPDLVLRVDDFLQIRANWRPKHDNLVELARDLNVGVDSVVFVDDSSFECGLVRRELPGVAVVAVDEEPARHVERLLADGWFDVRQLTADDLARPARYQQEQARLDFLDGFDSLDGYLRELDIRVELAPATPAEYARVSQLTLRTNQFNLTTRRLEPAQIRTLAEEPTAKVLTISSADRFGSNGLVGAVIVRRTDDTLHIDNFLLSCRVFSRGIEQSVLGAVLRDARAGGVSQVVADYRRTPRNGVVADFYPRWGFEPVSVAEPLSTFRHRLDALPEPPAHIRLSARFELAPKSDSAPEPESESVEGKTL